MQHKILHFAVVFITLIFPVRWAPEAASFTVRIHPDAPLVIGDQLSFEVISPQGAALAGKEVEVELAEATPRWLGKAQFQSREDGSYLAVMYWVWNTSGFDAGSYTLRFKILPEGESWEQTITLQPESPQQTSRPKWATAQLACCQVNYITQTKEEQDLPEILPILEAAADSAENVLNTRIQGKVPVNLIPRQLGQGGFTSSEIYISYPEVDYSGIDLQILFEHEIIHYIDRQRNHSMPPLVLAEGLAVAMSGGHYKQEPILLQAAALVQTGKFIPYPYLADNFSQVQHEVAYIEAGALVDYLVHAYGQSSFDTFYRAAQQQNQAEDAGALDAALQKTLKISLEDANTRVIDYLARLPSTPDVTEDVMLEIRYFDQIRAYQAQFEPSADYHQVWLPDGAAMRQQGITADYIRQPIPLESQLIESSLSSAGDAWMRGLYSLARRKISEVEVRLHKGPQN